MSCTILVEVRRAKNAFSEDVTLIMNLWKRITVYFRNPLPEPLS